MKNFIITIFLIVATREVGGRDSSDREDDQHFEVHIRLKGSSLPYAGRVEVSNDGEVWGTICDEDWSLRDARVICRQLNFSFTEAAVPMAGFGAGSGPIFLKDVKCTGSEQSLLKCKYDGWKSHDVSESCDHSMDAGVVCRPNKEMLSLIALIVVASLLVVSYLLNIWFVYYVCCKRKRKRKRHLTAVQQRALSRKKRSLEGLENLALDSEGCADSSTVVQRESPAVLQRNCIHSARSEIVRSEDVQTGIAASQQEQPQQHVYQRLESCILDPTSQEYLEMLESLPQGSTNQQPALCANGKSSKAAGYQSVAPQASDSKEGEESQYEKLLLRNRFPDEAQASSAEQDANAEIPDYVEIIGDGSLAGNAMVTATSPAATVKVTNPYETLKPTPGPSHHVHGGSAYSALAQDPQQSVRAESQEDADYLEPLPQYDHRG